MASIHEANLPGEATSLSKEQGVASKLQEALRILSNLEGRETFGDFLHNERNKIDDLINAAEKTAETERDKKKVLFVKTEINRRIVLLYTWGVGIIPAALSGNRDLDGFDVAKIAQKDILTSDVIGGLINDVSTLNPERAIELLTNEKGGSTQTVELGALTFRRTPMGEVMRFFDGVLRGSIKVEIPGQDTTISSDNIQANLDTLISVAKKRFERYGVPSQTIDIGFRLWWAITFHPSYWMDNPEDMKKITTPTLADWFFKIFRADQYQTKYVNRSTDSFLPDLVRLMFGVQDIRQPAALAESRLDDKIMEEFLTNLKKIKIHPNNTNAHEFHDYEWLVHPIVKKGVAHTQQIIEGSGVIPSAGRRDRFTPVDYGWSFMPPLAFFKGRRGVNFYGYESSDSGELIYEGMPWGELPSNAYGDYIVKTQNGPLLFAKKMMYENALTVTAKMFEEVTYASWKNTILYTVPMTRGLYKEESEAAQHKLRLIFFISGILYRTIRSDHESRWDDRKVKKAIEAAVSADFITHNDGQMVEMCWIPIIRLLLERVQNTLQEGLKYGGAGNSGKKH